MHNNSKIQVKQAKNMQLVKTAHRIHIINARVYKHRTENGALKSFRTIDPNTENIKAFVFCLRPNQIQSLGILD